MRPGTRDRQPLIASRWRVLPGGRVLAGWPPPGAERWCVALGWSAMEAAIGVIEIAPDGVDRGLLDVLDRRYPGRRWFEGPLASRRATRTPGAGRAPRTSTGA